VFEETAKLPSKLPAVVGLKLTAIAHVPLGSISRFDTHDVEEIEKGLSGLMRTGDPRRRLTEPLFSITIKLVDVLPINCVPKLRLSGSIVKRGGAVEVPVIGTTKDETFTASATMVRLLRKFPAITGK
jgi:hypothetical protein